MTRLTIDEMLAHDRERLPPQPRRRERCDPRRRDPDHARSDGQIAQGGTIPDRC
jgi:hypothetical protein